MQLIKAIILSIFNGVTNTLPISYSSLTILFQSVFNTNTFDNANLLSLLNISVIIAIILSFYKDLLAFFKKTIKLKKTKNKQTLKLHFKYIKIYLVISILSTIIYSLCHTKTSNLKLMAFSYLITGLILFLSTNKKGETSMNHLTYKNAILLGMSPIITFFPTISPLCSFLFICSRLHLNKETSLRLSLLCTIPILFLNSLPGLTYYINSQTYFINSSISIILSTFLSLQVFKYLKNLYNQNKLYKLSIYCLFLFLFILIWFR